MSVTIIRKKLKEQDNQILKKAMKSLIFAMENAEVDILSSSIINEKGERVWFKLEIRKDGQ